ncbi:chloride channel protein [Treponema zioleckii]|uniref:chloride channel protein n=1 Tax=Treponema zioleckii TaxID=331680 RepID=UPI0018D61E2B|nr:chloride channel protein [Treponema zioleckii]
MPKSYKSFITVFFSHVVTGVKSYRSMILLSILALPLGAIVSLAEVFFGKGLELVTEFRTANPLYFMPFLAIAGLVIVFMFEKFGLNGKCRKGMGLVFDAAEDKNSIPLRLAPLMMIGSWLTHLCGGSAGREGVAVQIGASITDQLGARLKLENCRDTFIIIGMAAGFAGLFQTPFAACFFAIEVLVAGEMKYKSLFPAVIASFTSYFIAHYFGLRNFSIKYLPVVGIDQILILKLIALGFIFGFAGTLFAEGLKYTKKFLSHVAPNRYVRAVSAGVILSAFFILLDGKYSGFGTNLTIAALNNQEVFWYDWILKMLFTIFTLSAGFMGGELTPIFSIGANLGAIVAPFFGLDSVFVAALGFSAAFGSATNTLFAPIFIGVECFGANYLPYMIVVCGISKVLNFGKSIYSKQKSLEDF